MLVLFGAEMTTLYGVLWLSKSQGKKGECTMKNLSLFISSLAMILVMASCQTAPEVPAGKDKPEKTTVTTSLDLNGKWIVSV